MATTIKAMLNTDRVLKSGHYPITIRIISKRKKKLIYTKHKVTKEDFDTHTGTVIWFSGSSLTKRKVAEINREIRSTIRELEKASERLVKNDVNFSVDDIIERYGQDKSHQYFFLFAQKEIESKEDVGKYGTADLYKSTISSFRSFVVNEKLKFGEITYSLLKGYSKHLQARGVALNTINMYLRNIRAIYNIARKESVDVGKISPFEDLRINTLPTPKRALSKDAILAIAEFDFSGKPKLERARDLFMFSFYTRGMSFVDLVFLRHTNIVSGVIKYKRNKTQQYLQVAVTRQLISIIDKYRNSSPFVLPFLKIEDERHLYVQYRRALFATNMLLKEVGREVGIETPLTTYVARHSWATIAKDMGGSITAISEGLGHTTEKTTQIYLKAFDNSVIDALNSKVSNLK